ncbi:transcriptional regulator [Roseobacter sp. GAI101]|nr:transcriptional regulator [Roseobacter sp. GAI101]
MHLLEQNPELSQRQLADALGISLGAVNYCLRALVEKGEVKIRNFRAADNKLRYAYILTPKGIRRKSLLTAGFLQRKLREYNALKDEIAALKSEAGTKDQGS